MLLNSHQIPNALSEAIFRGDFSPNEVRILLLICRKTIGWNKETEWMSIRYIEKLTGIHNPRVSSSLKALVDKKAITLDKIEGRFFYSLNKDTWGTAPTDLVEEKRTAATKRVAGGATERVAIKRHNKIKDNNTVFNTLSKAKVLNTVQDPSFEINELIELFKPINPSYEILFRRNSERQALARLAKKLGEEKLKRLLEWLPTILGSPYAPTVSTPIQLEYKLGNLVQFYNQQKNNKPKQQWHNL